MPAAEQDNAGLHLPSHPKRDEFVARLLKNDALWLDLQGREFISRPPGNDVLCNAVMVDLHRRGEMKQIVAFARRFHTFMPVASRPLIEQVALLLGAEAILPEALAMLEIALRYTHDKARLLHYIGLYLSQLGRLDEAKAQLARALVVTPGHMQSLFLLAQLEMMESSFKNGLERYECRFGMPDANPIPAHAKRWRGEPVEGKRVRIWGEQGIGDIIMFAGFIPWLLEQQPAKLTLCVSRKMQALFARSFPAAHIEPLDAHAFMNAADSANYDAEAPIGDLARYAMPHYTPAAHKPYLRADPAVAATLRQKLLPAGATRLVGFSWATINTRSFAIRNIPLDQWGPIFSVPGCIFVPLQHGPGVTATVNRVVQANGWPLIADPGFDPVRDTDQLAGLIAATDEVISAQNSNVHLAGALGVPATLMLGAASDFRWMLKRTDSLWYSSVTIERQERLLQWQPVIERVAEGLRKRAA